MYSQQLPGRHDHSITGNASIGVLSTAILLAGALPTKQYKLVAAWLVLHEDEIYAAWNNAVASKPFGRIAPLS